MIRKCVGVLAVCLPFAGLVLGDTLILRNGAQFSGKMHSAQNGSISFTQAGGQNRRFNVNEVGRIEFNATGGTVDRINSDNYGTDE
jgi:hypothetical protein